MKNIFGFLTVVIFSVAVSTFARAEESASGAVVAESAEVKSIMSMMDKMTDNAPRRELVVESTSVLKDVGGKRAPKASSHGLFVIGVSEMAFSDEAKKMVAFADKHFAVLANMGQPRHSTVTFYSSSGDIIRTRPMNDFRVSVNNKYLAGVSGGSCRTDCGGIDTSDSYVELVDSSGNLLWKRLGYKKGDGHARIGNYFVSSKGYVAIENQPLYGITVFGLDGKVIMENNEYLRGFTFSDSGDYYAYYSKNEFKVFSLSGEAIYSHSVDTDSIHTLTAISGSEAFILSGRNFRTQSVKSYYFSISNKEFIELSWLDAELCRQAIQLKDGEMFLMTPREVIFFDMRSRRIDKKYTLGLGPIKLVDGTLVFSEAFILGDKLLVRGIAYGVKETGATYVFMFDLNGNKLYEKFFGNEFLRSLGVAVNENIVMFPGKHRIHSILIRNLK